MFLLPLTPVQHQTVPLRCNGGGGGGGCSGGMKRATQRRCSRGAFALQSPPFSLPRSRGTSSSAAVPSGVQGEPAPVQRRVGLDSHRIGTVALAVSGGSRNSVLACCVAPASASRSPGTEHILFVERARMGCGRGKAQFLCRFSCNKDSSSRWTCWTWRSTDHKSHADISGPRVWVYVLPPSRKQFFFSLSLSIFSFRRNSICSSATCYSTTGGSVGVSRALWPRACAIFEEALCLSRVREV